MLMLVLVAAIQFFCDGMVDSTFKCAMLIYVVAVYILI
jgi:hypothetical protein